MYTNSSATYLTEEETARRDKHVDTIIQRSKWMALAVVAVGIYYFFEKAPPLALLRQEPKILIGALFVVVIFILFFFMSTAKWKRKKFDNMKVSYEAVVKRPYRQSRNNSGMTFLRDQETKYIKEEMFIGDDIIAKARNLKQGDTVRLTVTEQYGLILEIEKIDAAPLPAYRL